MAITNKGPGQRVQILSPALGSTYINVKFTVSTDNGTAVLTRVKNQEVSGGDLPARATSPETGRGYFTVTVENDE